MPLLDTKPNVRYRWLVEILTVSFIVVYQLSEHKHTTKKSEWEKEGIEQKEKIEGAPCQQEWLIQVVDDIDDDVVVGSGVDVRSEKFTIDKNALLRDSKWSNGAVRDVPCEEEVRVLTPDWGRQCCSRDAQQQHKGHYFSHL